VVGTALVACDDQPPPTTAAPTTTTTQVSEQLTTAELVPLNQPEFTQLLRLLDAAGGDAALSGSEDITLLAPASDAFLDLPDGELQAILSDPARARAVLERHLLPGSVDTAALDRAAAEGTTLRTVSGEELAVTLQDGTLSIGGVPVRKVDIRSSNGVVHVLAGVIPPPG